MTKSQESRPAYPTTVEGAVRLLRELVPPDEQIRISAMPADDLHTLHLSLGQWIRNYFGLWKGNVALLAATGESEADGASNVIIRAFWQRLRDELPKMH